jgi:hypothetical protein
MVLNYLVKDFTHSYRDWLYNPDKITGACEYWSVMFRDYYANASIKHVVGHRTKRPNRNEYHSGYANPDRSLYHVINKVDNWYIDFTIRQLDSESVVPLIMDSASFHKEWCYIADSWEILQSLIDIGFSKRQISREIANPKNYHINSNEELDIRIKESIDGRIKNRLATLENLKNGSLVITRK